MAQRKDESYLMVDGVNMVKKHAKPNPLKGIAGGIVDCAWLWPKAMAKLKKSAKRGMVWKVIFVLLSLV